VPPSWRISSSSSSILPSPQQQQQQHNHNYQSLRAFHQHRAYMPATADSTKMESRLMFESVWRRFEERFGQAGAWRTPREVVWLLGAPGAGKGVNTAHILRTRGLTKSFHMSGLLDAWPESRRLIDAGEMVPDALVCGLLLEALLLDEPGLQDDLGFVIDGFPRTAIQVGCVLLLLLSGIQLQICCFAFVSLRACSAKSESKVQKPKRRSKPYTHRSTLSSCCLTNWPSCTTRTTRGLWRSASRGPRSRCVCFVGCLLCC
jgi:hypothetical protein